MATRTFQAVVTVRIEDYSENGVSIDDLSDALSADMFIDADHVGVEGADFEFIELDWNTLKEI